MKTLYCLFFVALIANSSFAQNSILAGKIVDENGKPIAGAQIRVRNSHDKTNARSNEDGLFYTRLLPSANYQLNVVAGGKNLGSKKLYLPPQDKKKVYYTLKVTGDKMLVTVDKQNPFIKAELHKADEGPEMEDATFIIRIDSATGKPTSVIGPEGVNMLYMSPSKQR
jgi:hypothetical protein